MNKILFILAIFIMVGLSQGIYYTDNILSVYNNSCIETANYLFVQINNSQETLYMTGESFKEYLYTDILVSEIKEINNKTLLADIFIL
jgi:hypothetical protein